jgi:colanic acid biosynthesis glycosyl transferase WcaI
MYYLLLAQHYAPEEVSGAVLATELATDLVQMGHQVSFVTCAPNYPHGQVFSGYRNRLYQREMRDGVQVIRTWSYISSDKTFWRRILNYGSFSASAFPGALRAGKPDVVFCYSPPLALGISGWMLSQLWDVPWVLRVEDLYPDAAVAAGVLRHPTAIRFFQRLERFLYRRADHISLISEGFRRNLLGKGVAPAKLSVTPVWADPDIIRPMPKQNRFRQQYGLDAHFVVLYAGTLGHTSALEDVLASAARLRDQDGIRFVIVGEGVKKAALSRLVAEQRLDNVLMLPFQPRERFAEMLAAADVGLVTLNRQSFGFSLPSKIFNTMASARPILAVTPPQSEVAQLVQQGDCGINVPVGHPEELAQVIAGLAQSQECLAEMGVRGRQLLESRYSRQACIGSFARLLEQVASP